MYDPRTCLTGTPHLGVTAKHPRRCRINPECAYGTTEIFDRWAWIVISLDLTVAQRTIIANYLEATHNYRYVNSGYGEIDAFLSPADSGLVISPKRGKKIYFNHPDMRSHMGYVEMKLDQARLANALKPIVQRFNDGQIEIARNYANFTYAVRYPRTFTTNNYADDIVMTLCPSLLEIATAGLLPLGPLAYFDKRTVVISTGLALGKVVW